MGFKYRKPRIGPLFKVSTIRGSVQYALALLYFVFFVIFPGQYIALFSETRQFISNDELVFHMHFLHDLLLAALYLLEDISN